MNYLTVTEWMPGYQKTWLRRDLIAALTVWALLVPQGFAYGQLSGLPAIHGLYAALAGLVLYGLFGTSRHLNVGPEATVATLVATTVTPMAGGDPDRYLALVGILAILSGVVLVVAGLVRLGFITRFLSGPILTGYIAGSGIVIATGQLSGLLGLDVDTSQYHTRIGAVLRNLADTNSWDALVGIATIVVIVAIRRLAPKAPSYLIAVALAILASWAVDLSASGTTILGSLDSGLPIPKIPLEPLGDVLSLVGPAIAVGLLAFADSVTTVEAVAKQEGYRTNANREFFGLGAASLAAGFIQGFSCNGSQSRTFTLADAGGKTQVANWAAAVLVLATLIFLTPPFEFLPQATLAGMVIVVGIGLVDIREYRRLYSLRRADFVYAVVTTIDVVGLGMLAGILVAVMLSLLDPARLAILPHRAQLTRVPGTDSYRELTDADGGEAAPGMIIYRFDADLFFANVAVLEEDLRAVARDPNIDVVILDAESMSQIDSTALDGLGPILDDLDDHNTAFAIARLKNHLVDRLDRAGLKNRIGDDRVFLEVDDAVQAYEAGLLTDPTPEEPAS